MKKKKIINLISTQIDIAALEYIFDDQTEKKRK